ncbi:phage tail domain-containing protein [Paenibacillus tuaregi]|uniref:phage tail domain-containing protein n=1 Tax=Paenibacillus tuaregi TaxID=1816681 RepID=UPI00083934AF|nr:phage tail domain-containing protein [Paenibacillus tuaregi]
MARLLSYCHLNDVYTSLPIPIPLQADGVITSVRWKSQAPEQSQVIVQTRYSTDGLNWSEWRNCINGGQIPELNEETPTYGLSIMYRVLMSARQYDIHPTFEQITFSFEPVIVFDNQGMTACEPEIWITKVGSGDFSMVSNSKPGEEFKFKNLVDGETLYVHNEHQNIETSLPATYRYKDFNDNYLCFPPGKSILHVTGQANLRFRYQFKYI